jgi:hypothetical protein
VSVSWLSAALIGFQISQQTAYQTSIAHLTHLMTHARCLHGDSHHFNAQMLLSIASCPTSATVPVGSFATPARDRPHPRSDPSAPSWLQKGPDQQTAFSLLSSSHTLITTSPSLSSRSTLTTCDAYCPCHSLFFSRPSQPISVQAHTAPLPLQLPCLAASRAQLLIRQKTS